MAAFTILGAGGRIGQALVTALRPHHPVRAIDRAALPGLLSAREPAGHVICCIGLTGDFRTRPLATAEAHVAIPARILADIPFESFLYLSSTRVYAHAATTKEDALLPASPGDPSDLYNLTKLAGEALCLSDPRPTVRAVRLSNVFGPVADPASFVEKLKGIIAEHDILRLKGFADVPGKPMRLVIQAVGSRIDHYFDRAWAPGETRATRLVVIGLHDEMDDDAIRAALKAL